MLYGIYVHVHSLLRPCRPGAMSGEVGGGEGDDIDLPNLPDQPDNQDVDQDDLPMNAGGMWCNIRVSLAISGDLGSLDVLCRFWGALTGHWPFPRIYAG